MKFLKNKFFLIGVLVAIAIILIVVYMGKKPKVGNMSSSNLAIAIVNTEEIFSRAKAFQDVQKQVEERANALQQDNSKQQDQLQSEHKQIEAQRASLSEKAFTDKVNSLNKKYEDINKTSYMKRLVLDRAYKSAIKDIDDGFVTIVSDIAKRKGLNIVLNKMYAIYTSEGLNITDEVLAILNKQFPEYKVDFEAASKDLEKSLSEAKPSAEVGPAAPAKAQ